MEHLLEKFEIKLDEIILPEVADRFLSIGWVLNIPPFLVERCKFVEDCKYWPKLP